MDNKSCRDNIHQYGLWNINDEKKCAWRVCDKCNFKRELPVTIEIKEEVKKQKEAFKIFKAFQLVDNKDENIINYLDLIFEDYVNYLSKEDFALLVKRVKELEKLDIIDAQNILYLNQLETYFVVDEILDNNEELNEFSQVEDLNINVDSYEQG